MIINSPPPTLDPSVWERDSTNDTVLYLETASELMTPYPLLTCMYEILYVVSPSKNVSTVQTTSVSVALVTEQEAFPTMIVFSNLLGAKPEPVKVKVGRILPWNDPLLFVTLTFDISSISMLSIIGVRAGLKVNCIAPSTEPAKFGL